MSKITLDNVFKYLEERENCKVIKFNNNITIYDLKKVDKKLSNKELRLVDDLVKDFVKSNYPLFSKAKPVERVRIAEKLFKVPINKEKYLNVKSFRKITKETVIFYPNNGKVIKMKNLKYRNK